MDADLKRTWLEALRSGKFRQGTWALKKLAGWDNEPYHCCLGVLCEAAGLKEGELGAVKGFKTFWDPAEPNTPCSTGLPPAFRVRAGLDAMDEINLVRMNDQEGRDFGQIAEWIEKNL